MSLSNLLATHAVDVIGVYDTGRNQVFSGARPLKASVNDEATFFQHPLENSTNRIDHVVFMPVVVSLSLLLSGDDYKSVYQEIKQIYRNQQELVVDTKTDSYEKMFIQSMPSEESGSNFDSVIVNITLKETQMSTTEITFLPEEPSDTTTVDRGQQEPEETEKGSTLARWFK